MIPTYNRGYILEAAIRSVLEQDYRHVEVLVCDDGSSDDTRLLVEGFGPPVRYLRQENAGVAAARNLGLRHARGEFVALLDSDDRWLPWKLSAQVRLMREAPEIGMVWTDMTAVSGDGEVLDEAHLRTMYSAHRAVKIEEICRLWGRLGDLRGDCDAPSADRPVYIGTIFPEILLGNLVHTSTVLLRRDRLRDVGGFDRLLVPGEDYEYYIRACRRGPVGFIDASSMLYRIGEGDQITSPRNQLRIARHCLVAVSRWMEPGGERPALSAAMTRWRTRSIHAWIGRAALGAGDLPTARAHLWKSLRVGLPRVRPALLLAFALLPTSLGQATLRCYRGLKRVLRRLRVRRPRPGATERPYGESPRPA